MSHAHNKTRRRFLPNLQDVSVFSEMLGQRVRVRVSARALRTIERKGGIDAVLLSTKNADLTPQLRGLKTRIRATTS